MFTEQSSFDVKSLKAHFNKKANINKIYEKIQKKYSLKEVTIYAFVGYFRFKWNTLLVCFSNQKIFIDDEKSKISFCGVYTYKDIEKVDFFENYNNKLRSFIEMETENHQTIKIRGVDKEEFKHIKEIFKQQKEIYKKSFLEKVTNSDEKNFDLIDESYSYSAVSSSVKKQESLLDDINHEQTNDYLNFLKKPTPVKSINPTLYDSLANEKEISSNDIISQSNLLVESLESPKNKKVVNDHLITTTNTFSSSYLVNLLSNEEFLLPGGKKTIFYSLVKKIKQLESNSLAINGIDSTPVRLDKKVLKLNTVPIIVETKPINVLPTSESDESETRLIFARNWIEYTKHNVINKVLGVDANGNGAYIDVSKVTSSTVSDIYKAKEYKLNDEIRSGLRSSQTISFFEKNSRPGLDFFYNNLETGEKLNITKYKGILFLGIKYYFDVYNEFSKLQKKYMRIFVEDKKSNGDIFRKYELIFDDDLVTYKAYNERSHLIDDSSQNSSSYDLKWLTFFRE